MRQGRLKAPPGHSHGFYHCNSRVVDRRFIFGDREREQFVKYMREYERFCGVRVISYSAMSNHFHLVLSVPCRPEVLPSDEELIRKVEGLSGAAGKGTLRQMIERFRSENNDAAAEELRERYFSRMWDVSGYMKLLKQRFTQWYNRQNGRRGTLWEERFHSLLVEGSRESLSSVAAYVDLNPKRAQIVEDPKDYRWCSYAAALGGDKRAIEGLRVALMGGREEPEGPLQDPDQVLSEYRTVLFVKGEQDQGVDAEGKPLRKGFSREEVLRVIAERGKVSCQEYLQVRVRYFTDGAVLGSREFVNEVFQAYRARFGPRRKDGARRMRGLASPQLYTLRDLQLKVFG